MRTITGLLAAIIALASGFKFRMGTCWDLLKWITIGW